MAEYNVGDLIKYKYHPEKEDKESGWFICRVTEIRDDGRMIAELVDKGENTPYQSNTFRGIQIGLASSNMEPVSGFSTKTDSAARVGGNVIGLAPVLAAPKFVGPFEADTYTVFDANRKRVTHVDSDEGSGEDRIIAQVIAATLNEYYGV